MSRLLRGALIAMLAACSAPAPAQTASQLEHGFQQPPLEARTRAYWWWLNGNVSPQAITRDLEWMKSIGMGGGLIFDAGGPAGPTPTGPLFGSPAWRELFRHTLREAERLGLELSLSPQSGWNLGGPQVQPELAAKLITWSEQRVEGPAKLHELLSVPKHRDDFYRDTFVLAYRVSPAAAARPVQPVITTNSGQTHRPPELLWDGSLETFWISRGTESGQGPSAERPEWVALDFPQPVALTGLVLDPRPGYGPRECRWQLLDHGQQFRDVQTFTAPKDRANTVRFPLTEGRGWRLLILSSYDPKMPDAPRNVQIAELTLLGKDGRPLPKSSGARPITHLASKAAFHELGGNAADCSSLLDDVPDQPGDEDVQARDVLDLTGQLDAEGKLRWDIPPGSWQILRFGYTTNGAHVSTSSGSWRGMVVDYLDPDALRAYWNEVIAPLVADAGPAAGKTLKYLQTDSWELGGVNWTARFPAEFQRRRGYDLRSWLPVLAGRIVSSRTQSNRFLSDLRKTIADCITDNHYAVMAQLARQHGMGIHPESGGPHAAPLDALRNLGLSDMPMSEFWVPSPHRPTEAARFFVKQAACAAHIYGKRVVCAEGFTSIGPHWNDILWSAQKPSFDHEACAGLNLVFWHAFTCSPSEMGVPGQEYFAGTHFNPNITWADRAGAFIGYLNRCQFMLQQGQFVADVCYYYGDHVPNFVRRKQDDPAGVLPQYDYDVCGEEVLLKRMAVRDGRIVLPDGMGYRLLVLPNLSVMSLAALQKIHEMVGQGAVVVGPRPERTPGLEGYPDCDRQLHALGGELWGDCDGKKVTEHRFGKGRVVWGPTAKAVLAAEGVLPDFEVPDAPADLGMDFIHRRDGDAEIYFISHQQAQPIALRGVFRVQGKQPEIWDPITAQRRDAEAYVQSGGRTTVPLQFAPYGSLLIVFRKPIAPAAAGTAAGNFPEYRPAAAIEGPWSVAFDPKWGGPKSATFQRLASWTKNAEEGIRYYSGTATYRTTFDLPESARAAEARLALDLGEVMNLAEVRLNGQRLGIVWAPPFRVDVAGAARPTGNQLQIDVTNTWYNRLVGDERLPESQRLTHTNVKLKPGAEPVESGLLGPVRILVRQP